MKLLFKNLLIALILLSTQFNKAQEVTMISKSFTVNEQSQLLIEIDNETIDIIESPDDKVHVDYRFNFNNQTNKVKRRFTDNFKIKDSVTGNLIRLQNKSRYPRYRSIGLMYNTLYKKTIDTANTNYKIKSVNDFNIEKQKSLSYNSFYEEYFNERYKDDAERREKLQKKYNRWSRKKTEKNFVIKVPKGLKIDINGNSTILKFKGVIKNKLNIKIKDGRIYGESLNNEENSFNIDNTFVFISNLNGGRVVFDSAKKVSLGTISNVTIESSYSRIEIAQLISSNKITDFSSTYILYNNQKKSAPLDMKTEYSKVHYFKHLHKTGFTVFGNDIKLINHTNQAAPVKTTSPDYPIIYKGKNSNLKTDNIKMSYGIFYIQE